LKRWLQNLALLVGSTIVLLLLAEGGLRLLGFLPWNRVPDRTIGSVLVPGSRYRWRGEGASEGRINAAGWRDHDYTESRPPGTTRLLFLGDSFVEAFHVPLDSTFHKRLERILNARAPRGRHYEALALAQSGIGTTIEYLMYRRWGVRYDPDVVAVVLFLNDFGDNWFHGPSQAELPFFTAAGDSLRLDTSFVQSPRFRRRLALVPWRTHSSLVTLASTVLTELRVRLHPTPKEAGVLAQEGWFGIWNFGVSPPADSIPAFQLTARILTRFADEVRRDGRRFVVVVAGGAEQEDRAILAQRLADPTFDPDKPQRWLAALGQRAGFEVIALTPAFRTASAAGGGDLWCGTRPAFGHWNDAGHAVVADTLASYLAAHPVAARP
jgi:hypothetical protein